MKHVKVVALLIATSVVTLGCEQKPVTVEAPPPSPIKPIASILDLMAAGLVVEPLAELYKDEVREVGLMLGIPADLIDRHPFPGPGLGVRLLCSDGKDGSIPAEALARVEETLEARGLAGGILPVKSVGVQGDARTYAHPCVIRGTRDWSAADVAATDLLNRVRAVNRVVRAVPESA